MSAARTNTVGVALLNTLAITATASYLRTHPAGPAALAQASIHGNTVAFRTGAGVFAGGAAICGLLLRRRTSQPTLATEPVTSTTGHSDAQTPRRQLSHEIVAYHPVFRLTAANS